MSEVLPYIGAAIGSFWGPTGAQIGFMIGGGVAALTAERPHIQGPRLEDLKIIGTDYGQAIPWVSGSPRLAAQVIWASPLREIANSKKQGKGGGAKVTNFTYEQDVMLMLTENVTEGVARDWINNELVRNGAVVKGGVSAAVTVYTGAIDQMADPTYESFVGAGAPAYRGHTTIMIRSLQQGGGKQMPNIEHQVNTLGGLDLTGVIINAPLNEDYPGTDLAPSPQNASVSGPGVDFDEGAATIGPIDDQIAWSGGKASINDIPGGPRLYVAFDYTIEATAGSTLPGGLQQFINMPTGQPQYIRWMLQYQADGSLSLICQNFHTSPGAGGSVHNLPSSGRLGFVWPEGDPSTVEVYLNNTYVTSATAPSNLRNPTGFALLSTVSGAPDGRYVSRWSYANFFFGQGFDPVYLPLLGNTLKQTLDALLARAGYTQTEYSVDMALDDIELAGYATTAVTATRAHLDSLRPFGKFEANCSDRLYIFPRAVTPVGEIPWGDLGASESPGEPSEPFPLQMGNETEVPAQIAVRYRNVHADWNLGTEFSDRQVSSLVSTQSVDMPFGLTPSQAKVVADTILKDAIAGLGRATLKLAGRKHARFEPGDVLTTTTPYGLTYRFRIITKRDFLFMLEWEVALDDAAALTSEGVTFDGYVPNVDPVRVAPTDWETIAIPPLMDADATVPGPYVAVTSATTSQGDDWPGAVYVRARLAEAFDQVFTTGDRAVMGTCQTVLGDFPHGSAVPDWTQVLRVRVRGELSSVAFYDLFTDRTLNAAVVGSPGRWEPIRFLDATFVGADGVFNLYDIAGIMRGQLGQEHLIDSHESGDVFVLLDASVRRMQNQTTDIGQEHQVKAVTLNTFLSDVAAEDFTDDGIALRPYSPAHLLALAQSNGDLAVSWVRRSRLVARYTDEGTFAPVGEVSEAYRVRVFADPDASALRTVDVTTPAWTYSAIDQASDGFASGDPIHIVVRQISETVGEGFATTLETETP